MYTGILHLHRTIAYLALILVFVVMVKSLYGFINRKPHTEGDRKLGLFALIGSHLQLLAGLTLYFAAGYVGMWSNMSEIMKDADLRFKIIEHPFMMIIGIVFITVGYSQSKKATDDLKKHRLKGVFFLLGLACFLASTPWDRLF
ncbi:MAG: hypothetical protein KDC83_03360 [Flavobacteriales bacterium]|nr:hypothetical protein [Flavobacteriales bacterium]